MHIGERNQTPGKKSGSDSNVTTIPNGANTTTSNDNTWINDIFQGILTSETRCLNCETVNL